jgi:hypothetical protein
VLVLRLFLPLFILMAFFAACKEDHHIKVEKNGSATVSYNLHFVDSDSTNNSAQDTTDLTVAKDSLYRIFNSFYSSPLISNYECKISDELEVSITYKISDVNQLGKFLSPFLNLPITCKHSKKTFTIDAGTGNANAEEDIGGYTNMLAFKLTIDLPGKIKSVENSSGLPISYNGNQFTMESSVGMLNYSGKRNLVVIRY